MADGSPDISKPITLVEQRCSCAQFKPDKGGLYCTTCDRLAPLPEDKTVGRMVCTCDSYLAGLHNLCVHCGYLEPEYVEDNSIATGIEEKTPVQRLAIQMDNLMGSMDEMSKKSHEALCQLREFHAAMRLVEGMVAEYAMKVLDGVDKGHKAHDMFIDVLEEMENKKE